MKQLITTVLAFLAILILAISCDESTITYPPPPPSSGVYEKNDFEYQDKCRSRFANYKIPDLVPDVDIPNFWMKVGIGRDLYFFEENGVSCATCHDPQFGFTNGKQQSQGLPDDIPGIKSPSSISIAGSPRLLWNGAAGGSEKNLASSKLDQLTANNFYLSVGAITQVLFAHKAHTQNFTQDSVMSIEGLMEKFKLAYPKVDEKRLCEIEDIAECIAAFQMTLLPAESKQQRFLKKQTILTKDELMGWELFDEKCEGCHNAPYLGKDDFALTNTPPFTNEHHTANEPQDKGRFSFTGYPEDKGYFRAMNLHTNLTNHGCWGFSCESDSLPQFIQNHQLAYESKPLTKTEVSSLMAFFEACNDPRLSLVGSEYK